MSASIYDIEIIGMSGKIGSGKDYIAKEKLVEALNNKNPKRTAFVAFADHLKIDVISKYNIEFDRVYVKKDAESRTLLQNHGMECREKYGKDVWVRAVDARIKLEMANGIERIIITDLRLQNEMEYLQYIGATLVRVEAPRRTHLKLLNECNGDDTAYTEIATHISETDLDARIDEFDYVIHNEEDGYKVKDNMFVKVDDLDYQLEELVNTICN